MKFCAMAHILLAACALGAGTGGSRRRQRAAVPVGTKKVVEWIGFGAGFGVNGLVTSIRVGEIAARYNSVQWHTSHSPPARSAREPAAHAAGRGLSSLSGLRKWLSGLVLGAGFGANGLVTSMRVGEIAAR